MNDDLMHIDDIEDVVNDVIRKFDNGRYHMDDIYTFAGTVEDRIEKMKSVNAVELPCKIGDIIYIIRTDYYQLTVNEVVSITVRKDDIILNYIGTTSCDQFVRKISTSLIGEILFFTKEEAEAALREMKGDKINE